MTDPKTVKGYLKLLIQIADGSSLTLKNISDDEIEFIGCIRAGIQKDKLDDIINIINKNLFKVEDTLEKMGLSYF